MSVQTQQFRVVGVSTQTGKDVSVVIDAATKAAAEVKAEQLHIETTHIVRLKQDTPEPPDEHELFSSEAAEALAGNRTINLIEACVPPEEPRQRPSLEPHAEPNHDRASQSPGAAQAHPTTPAALPVVAAISRPSYAAPASQRDHTADQVSGMRAFALVLVVLLGISAGAYFVLVHQPNSLVAQDNDLVFGQDLFSDVLEPAALDPKNESLRDAFNNRATSVSFLTSPQTPPIPLDQQQNRISPNQRDASASPGSSSTASADASAANASTPSKAGKLKLQSIVTTNKGRFAIINAKLYEQGSNIGSAQLVSVADDWVLIERDGKQFTLQIESSPQR